ATARSRKRAAPSIHRSRDGKIGDESFHQKRGRSTDALHARCERDAASFAAFAKSPSAASRDARHAAPQRKARPARNRILRHGRFAAHHRVDPAAAGRGLIFQMARLAPEKFLYVAASALLLCACEKAAEPSVNEPTSSTPSSWWKPSPKSSAPAEIWKEFSGEKAFAHTAKLVEFGPRPSGSAELEKTRAYIIAALKQSGWNVQLQTFNDETPRGTVAFVNLVARFGDRTDTQRAIVCSHYDTKIFDTIHFVGASDGGSSTGALTELARVLALDPDLAKKTELVFFDGEEAVTQF